MRTTLFIAAAMLGAGIGTAYSGEGGTAANTWFTQLPGVVAQAPQQQPPPPAVAATQQAPATGTYATRQNRTIAVFNTHTQDGADN
ncbi:MAG: hypothetical protein WDN25_06575 [Acetobacteraceae bacterium]